MNVIVAPEARGQGYGKALVHEAVRRLLDEPDRHIGRIVAHCATDMRPISRILMSIPGTDERAVRRGEGRLCRRLARGKYVRVSWTSVLHCAPSAHALSIKADNRAVSRAARFAILAWRHSCAQAAPAPVNRTRSGRHDGANTPRQTGGAVSRAAFGLLLWWCNRAVRTRFCADPVPPSRGWRRQGAAPAAVRARGSAAASLSN